MAAAVAGVSDTQLYADAGGSARKARLNFAGFVLAVQHLRDAPQD